MFRTVHGRSSDTTMATTQTASYAASQPFPCSAPQIYFFAGVTRVHLPELFLVRPATVIPAQPRPGSRAMGAVASHV